MDKTTAVQRLRGIHAASVTPFLREGEPDLQGIRNIVDYYVESGLQGAFFPSSTGESFSMPRSTRVQVVKTAAEQAAGRIVTLANATASNWSEAVEMCKRMADAGADYAVCMPPTFLEISQEEMRRFFERIADESPIPIVVYTHLVRMRNKVELPLLMQLAEHENIAGIKDTHNDAARLLRLYATGVQKRFSILCGGDGMAGYSALLDMDMLNALCAVRPKLFINLRAAGRARDMERMAALQEEVYKLMALFTATHDGLSSNTTFGAAIKGALHLRGLCECGSAQLGYDLTERDFDNIRRVLDGVRDDVD